VMSAANAEPIAKVAIAAAATDLMKVRFVFMRFLQLVRTVVTLSSHCDGTVTHITVLFQRFKYY
jgi:hypothetical protein